MDAPTNPRLVQAIVAVLDARESELPERLRALLQELIKSTVIVAGSASDPEVVEVDDEDYLAVFTDLIELHFFEPGARWASIRAEEVIRKVAAGDYDGLVVNPGQRQFELSRDDVADFFDIDT